MLMHLRLRLCTVCTCCPSCFNSGCSWMFGGQVLAYSYVDGYNSHYTVYQDMYLAFGRVLHTALCCLFTPIELVWLGYALKNNLLISVLILWIEISRMRLTMLSATTSTALTKWKFNFVKSLFLALYNSAPFAACNIHTLCCYTFN